jgi:hypothetical protein
LQTALHDKAKGSPGFRFYALYDQVHRKDVLAFRLRKLLSRWRGTGVDGQNFEDIERYGVERWLDELRCLQPAGFGIPLFRPHRHPGISAAADTAGAHGPFLP